MSGSIVDELRDLKDKASPAPWEMFEMGFPVSRGKEIVGWDVEGEARIVEDADAALIIAMRNSLDELLALARRTVAAEQERDRLREALEDLDEFARYRAGYYQARETLRAREALASLNEEQKP